MATWPVTTFDVFSRTTASGWSGADNGQSWIGTGETHWSVDGTYGKLVVNASTFPTYDYGYIDLSLVGFANPTSAEVLVLMKWGSSKAYPITDGGPMLSRSSSNTFYFVRIQDNYDALAIAVYSNGTIYELNRTGKVFNKDTQYWVRFRRDSSGLKVRVWAYGSAEPTGWTLTSGLYDGVYKPGAGPWGFVARKTTDTHTYYVKAYYGYNLSDDAILTMPVVDTFERVVSEGWGINAEGQQWEGNFSLDPSITVQAGKGSVEDAGDGNALWTQPDDTIFRSAAIGPLVSGDRETYAKMTVGSSAGVSSAFLGLRGTTQVSGGAFEVKGYLCKFTSAGTNLSFWKITSFGGALTSITLSTNTAFTAPAASQIFHIRFQIIGTTLQARFWLDGTTEPSTWHAIATDSSITGSGRGFLAFNRVAGNVNNHVWRIYQFEYDTPTIVATTYTQTGTITSTAITDTTLALRANYTQDTDNDNSVTVEYKKSTDTTWTTFGGTKTRTVQQYWSFTITGLEKNTLYNVRVTYVDPDTVKGTNPRTANFTTTNTALDTGVVSITAVGATTIDCKATYTGDTNNNSLCVVDYRVSSTQAQPVNDTFFGGNGTILTDHLPDVGSSWIKHTQSSTDNAELWQGRVYPRTLGSFRHTRYYNNIALPTVEYEVQAELHVYGLTGRHGLLARVNTGAHTYYKAGYDFQTLSWEITKTENSVITVLGTATVDLNIGSIYTMKFIIRDAYKALEIDGIEVIRTSDNTITAAGYAGIGFQSTSSIEGSAWNQPTFDNFVVTYRTNSGVFVSAGSMTADRVNKWFTKSITGLSQDTVYDIRFAYGDADGVFGGSGKFLTAMTIGQAIQLTSMGAATQPTSASVDVFYAFDSNNNSSMAFQYRSLMDSLWTTVPSTLVSVNRTAKKFSVTIPSLKPASSYEIRATPSDPNGIVEGTPSYLQGTFTTKGFTADASKETKHYLWKIYDPDGKYVTTWHDAGEPSFAWHENGGISDLTVTLPRKISDLQEPNSGIDYQHRVDVWCLDPSSNGFGPNKMIDPEFTLGAWTLGSNASIDATGGPDDSSALKIVAPTTAQVITRSPAINTFRQMGIATEAGSPTGTPYPLPYVIQALAKGRGSKLTMFAESYSIDDVKLDTSNQIAETVGANWQNLRIEYIPHPQAYYIRVAFQNDGKGSMWADKVRVQAKEELLYRGRIESYTPKLDQDGESIEIQVLGLVSLLSDDYIEFLQFVTTQQTNDSQAARPNEGPADPADMMRRALDIAKQQNPQFLLYYTTDSIHNTGDLMEYTFRDQQLRAIFDKIRALCPPDWHYYIEPDGLVNLRGPEHAPTHKLRLGVEIMNFSVERSIRNLKNYIVVKGRQDEDESEPDGFGSIRYVTFDQASVDTYGKRMLFIRDANITDPKTAETVGDGRLVEFNRDEQRAQCIVPDEKSITYVGGSLRGTNIEAFRPGDNVVILDPVAGPRNTYWDFFSWDQGTWDSSNDFAPLPEPVPIKTVQFNGVNASLELSERQPSSVSDFGRLYRWLQLQDSEKNEGS